MSLSPEQIQAIKLYRERTGCSLVEARRAVLFGGGQVEDQSDIETLRARLAAVKDALASLPCMFEWGARREGKLRKPCRDYEGFLPEHAWCPVCRAQASFRAA